jgi:hypothetical protein
MEERTGRPWDFIAALLAFVILLSSGYILLI